MDRISVLAPRLELQVEPSDEVSIAREAHKEPIEFNSEIIDIVTYDSDPDDDECIPYTGTVPAGSLKVRFVDSQKSLTPKHIVRHKPSLYPLDRKSARTRLYEKARASATVSTSAATAKRQIRYKNLLLQPPMHTEAASPKESSLKRDQYVSETSFAAIKMKGLVPHLFALFKSNVVNTPLKSPILRALQKTASLLAIIPFEALQLTELIVRTLGLCILGPTAMAPSKVVRNFYNKQFVDLTRASVVNLWKIARDCFGQLAK